MVIVHSTRKVKAGQFQPQSGAGLGEGAGGLPISADFGTVSVIPGDETSAFTLPLLVRIVPVAAHFASSPLRSQRNTQSDLDARYSLAGPHESPPLRNYVPICWSRVSFFLLLLCADRSGSFLEGVDGWTPATIGIASVRVAACRPSRCSFGILL